MSLLFQIDLKNKIVLANPCIKLCPVLKLLDQQQLLYVILVYDYSSKYHQFPLEERKRRAIFEVYGEDAPDPETNRILKQAIPEYRGLQYDAKRETVTMYNDKIARLRNQLMVEDTTKKITDLTGAIGSLQKSINEIQKEIETSLETIELHGGGRLSLLESIQDKLEKFRREMPVTAKEE